MMSGVPGAIAILLRVVAGLGAAGLVILLIAWRVAGDVRRRERGGTDPESLHWRSRYSVGYPRD
jgi:hypothetical protein